LSCGGPSPLLIAIAACQTLGAIGQIDASFESWRPTLYAYVLWAICLCWARCWSAANRASGRLVRVTGGAVRRLMVVFPLLFGLVIAFSDWNLSSPDGRQFNGLDNVGRCGTIRSTGTRSPTWFGTRWLFWSNTPLPSGWRFCSTARSRRGSSFRVAFLLPLMLSPVAVSWMIGKSMLEVRFGPISRFLREIGCRQRLLLRQSPSWRAFTIMIMDAWTFIPFMMIMILAGLQAIPKEVQEAAKVDGASGWRGFWEVTFPLMLPVSITAILIRIIFKLKLADIIINVTAGGPGGATDSVTSFIFREYRDRSNVGYGTCLPWSIWCSSSSR
jgi:multiple sugar transport system permease protein